MNRTQFQVWFLRIPSKRDQCMITKDTRLPGLFGKRKVYQKAQGMVKGELIHEASKTCTTGRL